MRRALVWILVIALLAAGYLYGRDYVRRHPQDVPWTALDLRHQRGWFTLRKLTALRSDPAQCRALIALAGADDAPVPPRMIDAQCGFSDGMRLANTGRSLAYAPAGLVTSCPVAAALILFEREVAEAARRHLGTEVTAVDHAGSYSCRRIYGRAEGRFSEHSTASALDITGFRLADGSRVSVLRDWSSPSPRSAFLREVRDSSCGLFATVLSPDYNAAHADHLHFDLAERGRSGWSLCR